MILEKSVERSFYDLKLVVDEERTIGDALADQIVIALGKLRRKALWCPLAGEKPQSVS